MGQTIAESIWEEGWTKGRTKGLSEGRSEGQLELAQRLLRQLLSDRFGTVPEAVLERIDHATDVERLTAAALQVSHIGSVEDVAI